MTYDGAIAIFMPQYSDVYKYQLSACSSTACFNSPIFYVKISCIGLTFTSLNSSFYTVSKNNPT